MDLVLNNDDLLTEILLRLPVKSLIRSKTVCKNWLDLISSDYFSHQHTFRRPKLQQSLILEISTTWQNFYFNPTTDGEKKMIPYSLTDPDLRIIHACNGLFLLESMLSPCSQYTYSDPRHPIKSFYVYNPATKRSRKIYLTKSCDYPYVAMINLAFNPAESLHYKIVCLKSDAASGFDSVIYTYQIEVYDSESPSWKLGLEGIKYLQMYFGEYWNNAIYWSSRGGYFKFDIAKNETRTFHFPDNPYGEWFLFCFPYLQELNGHLYHYLLLEQTERESVALWELGGEEKSEWLLKYYNRITLTAEGDGAIGCWRLVESDGDGVCSLLTYLDGKIWAYNFLDKSYKLVLDLKSQPFYQPNWRFSVRPFHFGETLALV